MSKKTDLIAQYKRERRRINQFIKRAEQRGYDFYEFEPPKQPKRITEASIRRLKQLTPEKLYGKAYYYDTDNGKFVSGTEGRKIERRNAARLAAHTRALKKEQEKYRPPKFVTTAIGNYDIIEQIKDEINSWNPDSKWLEHQNMSDVNKLAALVRMFETEEGKTEIIKKLTENAERVTDIVTEILYDSDRSSINAEFSELTSMMLGRSLTSTESNIMNDISEQYNEST